MCQIYFCYIVKAWQYADKQTIMQTFFRYGFFV